MEETEEEQRKDPSPRLSIDKKREKNNNTQKLKKKDACGLKLNIFKKETVCW